METYAEYVARMKKQEQDRNAAAAGVVLSTVEKSPDEVAGDIRLADEFSRETGKPKPPLDMVSENRSVFQQEVDRQKTTKLLNYNPKLAEFVRDPVNAALFKDSLEEMSFLEQYVAQPFRSGVEDIAMSNPASRAVARGTATYLKAPIYTFGGQVNANIARDIGKTREQIEAEILSEYGPDVDDLTISMAQQNSLIRYDAVMGLGDEEKQQYLEASRQAFETARGIIDAAQSIPMSETASRFRDVGLANAENSISGFFAAVGEDPTGAVAFVLETAAESIPMLGVATAATLVGGPVAGAGTMGVTSFAAENSNEVNQFLQEKGVDFSDREAAFAILSNPEIMKEANRRGLTRGLIVSVFDTISGGVAGQTLSKSPIGNMLLQGLTQAVLGSGGEAAAQAANGDTLQWADIIIEGLAELATAPLEMAGVGGQMFADRAKKADEARQTQERVQGFVDAAMQAKVRERAPDAFRDYLTRTLDGKDAETMYVPADKFTEYFQSVGMNAEEVISGLDGVDPNQFAEAVATGGDIAIPTATFAAKIAGSEHDQFLLQNARFNPDDMTFAEAEEWEATKSTLLDEAMQQAETIRAQAETEIAAGQAVFDTMAERLTQSGQDATVARQQAAIWRSWYETRAARSGKSVAEVMAMAPLPEVRGPSQQGSQAQAQADVTEAGLYDQTGRAAVDSEPFKQWFGESKTVDESGVPIQFYTGTSKDVDFKSFKVGRHGAWFSSDPEIASQYALENDSMGFKWDGGRPTKTNTASRVIPAYLNLSNPFTGPMPQEVMAENYKKSQSDWFDALRAQGYDGWMPADQPGLAVVLKEPTQIKSTFNRGTFDRSRPNILDQDGVPLFDRPLTIDGKVTIRAVGEAMTADHMAKHGRQFFPEDSEEDYKAVLGWAAGEVATQLQHPNSGVGWYSADVQLSMELAAQVYPTLATNPTHRDLYLVFAGLFSNGAEPEGAFMNSAEAFETFLATGEIPVNRAEAFRARGEEPRQTSYKDRTTGEQVNKDAGWGIRNPANEQQLAFVKYIFEREGGVDAGINWLRTKQPRTEINRAMTESGLYKAGRYTTKAEIAGEDAYGIMAFGEKLGRYTMGLHGVEIDAGDTTIDLWYSRTYRRLTGRLLETPIGAEGVVSGPTDQDRKVIFRMTGDLVKQFDLPAGDIQAVLWFWEKRLWGAQGVRTSEGTNSSGARKLLRAKGLDDGTGSDGQGDGAGGQAAGREYAQAGSGDRGTGYASGGLAPLAGAPTVEGASGPDPRLVAVAEKYAADNGIPLQRQATFVEVDAERATRIAAAYDAMEHAPNDPRVKEAFENLIEQTKAQYQALADAGYQFFFIDPENDLYEGNPWNAMRDLRANQRMAVFPTEAGFGSGATDTDISGNPMEVDTGLEWAFGAPDGPKKRVLANDLFRAVHDAFGHGLEGAGFRARGEENAWQAHVRLFTGSAVAAITTETRGQNSWLNYGPHGETNRNAKVEDTVFADQKTGLLPEWAWLEGRALDEAPVVDERGHRYIEDRPQLPIGPDGLVELTHWSSEQRDVIDPKMGGTGPLVGPDRRAMRKWAFYGIDARTSRSQTGRGYIKENGLGNMRHTVKVDPARLYPWYEDPDGIKERMPRTSRMNVDAYAAEIRKAGYLGHYVTDDGEGSAVHGLAAAVYEPLTPDRVVEDVEAQEAPARQYGQGKLFTPATPEEMTQTEAFKNWFGQSKAVDNIGRPLVVFHGSEKAGFTVFDTDGKGKTRGTGAFFTSNIENARTYSGTRNEVDLPNKAEVLKDPEKYGFEVFEYGDGTVFIRDPDGYDVEVEGAEDMDDSEKIAAFMEPMIDDWLTSDRFGEEKGNYSVFLKIEKPMTYDAQGRSWDALGGDVYHVMDDNGYIVEYFYDEDEAKQFLAENPDEEYTVEQIVGSQTTDEIVREARDTGEFDGVIFKNINDEGPYGRGYGIESDVYVVFEPSQIKAVQNRGTFDPKSDNILEQSQRGSIMFPAGGIGKGEVIINLFRTADLSTFSHESGHFFLTAMQEMAARGDTSAAKEFEVIKAWWNSNAADVAKDASRVTGVAVSAEDVQRAILLGSSGDPQKDNAIDVGMQEQWARAFETYLMEGKAPSVELRGAFERFADWLKSVYKSLTSLNVKVSPELKGVFDRMLATDQQIEAAKKKEADLGPLFKTAAEMGLTDEEYEKYKALAQQAEDEATGKLRAEIMAPIQRAQQQWWRDERAKLVETLTAEKQAQPIYRAIQEMRFGQTFEGDETPGIKLNRKALEDGYGVDILARLPGAPKTGKGHRWAVYATGEGGMHPDVVAEMYGFGNGRELVEALTNTPKLDDAVEAEADALMTQRHGDILLDGKAAQAAMDAIKGDKKARLISMELAALNAKLEGDRGLRRSLLFPKVSQFREMARRTLDRMVIKDARAAQRYVAASRKASDDAYKALAKGDIRTAAEAKRRHLLSHMMYMEARKIDAEVEKLVNRLSRLNRADSTQARGVDVDHIRAARAIAAKFGLANGDSQFDFDAWSAQLQQDDPATYAALSHAIQTYTQNAKPFKALTVGEFRAVADAVANLVSLGKTARTLEIEGQQMAKDQIIAELSDVLAQRGLKQNPALKARLTAAQRMGKSALSMLSALRRVEAWARDMDDGDQGPFTRYLVRPVMDALGVYRDEKAKRLDQMLAILNPRRKDLLSGGSIAAPELGYTFETKAELIHAILHTGNESNKEKLLMGRGWSTGLINQQQKTTPTGKPSVDRKGQPIMDRGTVDTSKWDAFITRMVKEGKLSKEDFDMAQSIWDLMEELKRPAQTAHRKMFGFYFGEVEASPVVTPFGTYRGGYVPAIADQDASNDGQIRADQNALEMQQTSFMFPTTGSGFTKARVEQYRTPLALDLMLLPAHMDKVLRFTHVEPTIRQTAGIITARDMREAMDTYDQSLIASMLTPWLQRTAQQAVEQRATTPAGRAFSNIARELRRRVGIHTMFMNVVNTAQQITGFSTAMVLVKPYRMSAALARYTAGGAFSMRAEAMAQSAFMRERVGNAARETQRRIQEAVVKPTIPSEMRALIDKHGYVLQQVTQNIMDVMIWHAAYDQAIAKRMSEADAVFEADSVVRRTIGDFAPENLSLFETGNAFTRLFTMFYSYFNGQANLVGGEMKTAMRTMGWRGSPRMFWVYLMGIAAPAIIADLIVRGFQGDLEDEDDDGYADEIAAITLGSQARYITAMVPVAGQVTMAMMNRFNDMVYDDRLSTSPVVSTVERAAGAPASIAKAVQTGEGERRAVMDGLTLMALVTGIPMGQLAKMTGYAMDVSSGDAQPQGPADVVQGLTSGKDGTKQ